MKYSDLVKEYIRKSGMSLSEIVSKIEKEHGVKIDRTYLSRLQNGKTNQPASDEVNRALALVTGGDVEELLMAALIEKAPAEIKDMVRLLNTMKKLNGDLIDLDPKMVTIPVLGYIAAGKPIFADEHIIDWDLIPRPAHYEKNGYFALIVKGDSMVGSGIYDGYKVIVKVQSWVEDGEIAVVNVDGENATLKRVKYLDGKIVLMADNPKYDPIIVDNENARIVGKVIQVIFDPNKK